MLEWQKPVREVKTPGLILLNELQIVITCLLFGFFVFCYCLRFWLALLFKILNQSPVEVP